MIYLSEIALLGITVLEAWWHSRLIAANRPIKHGWWALAYALLVGATDYYLRLGLLPLVLYTMAAVCGHAVVFNIALNRFRGLSWTYVSKTSTSIIDQAELKLFGSRVWLLEVFLGVVFLTIQLFL